MQKRLVFVVAVLGLAASSAQAGWFGGGDKLPRPIDSPMVRPKLEETHKGGTYSRPGLKYDKPTWGANWKQIFTIEPRPVKFHLR